MLASAAVNVNVSDYTWVELEPDLLFSAQDCLDIAHGSAGAADTLQGKRIAHVLCARVECVHRSLGGQHRVGIVRVPLPVVAAKKI